MKHITSLPEPSADALIHSQKLVGVILKEIKNNKGSISFKRYMEIALYEPALGYYVAGSHKIGAQGDFITAPEISPLYSQCIANQCAEILKKVGGCPSTLLRTSILELGAGSGTMAKDILLELERQRQLPEKYYILDLSPDLIQRQQQTIQQYAPHLLERIEWLSQLPEEFTGVIIGNEVLDAMPVDVFTLHDDNIYEHHVIWEDGKLLEQLQAASEELQQRVQQLNIPQDATPYTSEINPNIEGWLNTLNSCLNKGVILLADYGYPRSEYYLADRNKGTLICHYQHLVNDAPLHYPGLQDITASVDFTAVAEAADTCELNVAGFTSQAGFLANSGLEQQFMDSLEENPDMQYKLAQQVRMLSLPSEMGERFKFIALTKNFDESLIGFSTLDQRYRL